MPEWMLLMGSRRRGLPRERACFNQTTTRVTKVTALKNSDYLNLLSLSIVYVITDKHKQKEAL